MTTTILEILASGLGIFAAYYISTKLKGWLQSWDTKSETTAATDARTQAQTDDQDANAQSDALKKLDGR